MRFDGTPLRSVKRSGPARWAVTGELLLSIVPCFVVLRLFAQGGRYFDPLCCSQQDVWVGSTGSARSCASVSETSSASTGNYP